MPIWGVPRLHEGAPVLGWARALWRARRCHATRAGTVPLGLATWGLPSWSPGRVLTRPPADHGFHRRRKVAERPVRAIAGDDVRRRLAQQPEKGFTALQARLGPDRLGHILKHTEKGDGAALVGARVLYKWPTDGWVLGRVRRACRRPGFST
jgi:hypothetical protein